MRIRDHLLMAIISDHHEAVGKLIKKVDPSEEYEKKQTPIELAHHLGHWECVEAIAKNKKTDPQDRARYGNVLLSAVAKNRLTTAKILLEAGASHYWYQEPSRDSCLHIAVDRSNIEMIVLLLSFNFDLTKTNTAGQTPIQLANELDDWNCVEAIAKNKKADIHDEARYGDALRKAVMHNKTMTAKILLEAGASHTWHTPSNGDRCLHIAIRKNNLAMIALLLSFDFSIHTENDAKETPLKLAKHLHPETLNKAWRMMYDVAVLKPIAETLVQGLRQNNSKIYPFSNPKDILCLNLIMSFLYLETRVLKQTIQSTQDRLYKVSAQCLIKSFNSTFTKKPSASSKKFIVDLKKIVETNDNITNNIANTTIPFIKSKNGRQTKTIGLLHKYKLADVKKNSTGQENKKNYKMTTSGFAKCTQNIRDNLISVYEKEEIMPTLPETKKSQPS